MMSPPACTTSPSTRCWSIQPTATSTCRPVHPCIDAGDPVNYPATDFEGDPRPIGPAPDIGADEFNGLWLTKTGTPEEVLPGGTITYNVTVVNQTAVTLTNVLLTDTLPVETAFTGYQANGLTCAQDGSAWGGQVSCTLDSAALAVGESRLLTLTVITTDTLPLGWLVVNEVATMARANGETFTAHDQARTEVTWCKVQLNDSPIGTDIQAAIDASTLVTDVVKVSGYCNVHDMNLNKTLTIQGGWRGDFAAWDPSVYTTTLDAQQLGRVLAVTGVITPVIEGFFITGGVADTGGGISIDSGSPTIQRNTFTGNQAGKSGGGLFNFDGNPVIQYNTFSNNLATGSYGLGGGLYSDQGNPSIQNNLFSGNQANFGGGLYINTGSPLIQDNIFSGDQANHGGGLYINTGSSQIQKNTFSNNQANYGGGGILICRGSSTVQNNLISGNHVLGSGGYGGGISISGSPNLQNNTIAGNESGYGGGAAIWDSSTIQNNDLSGNSASTDGGGIYNFAGSPNIRSNIVVNNLAPSGGGISNYTLLGSPLLDYNDVWNNPGGNYSGVVPGVHDISSDPRLVDPTNGDFHLLAGSACIDAGDPDNYPATDFEGDLVPDRASSRYWRR